MIITPLLNWHVIKIHGPIKIVDPSNQGTRQRRIWLRAFAGCQESMGNASKLVHGKRVVIRPPVEGIMFVVDQGSVKAILGRIQTFPREQEFWTSRIILRAMLRACRRGRRDTPSRKRRRCCWMSILPCQWENLVCVAGQRSCHHYGSCCPYRRREHHRHCDS